MKPSFFKSKAGKLKLPVFFPDATRAVVRTLDTKDIEKTNTKGLLINTLHLYSNPGEIIPRAAFT